MSDADRIRLFEQLGAAKTAKRLGITERAVYDWRKRAESRHHRPIASGGLRPSQRPELHPQRIYLDIRDGIVLIGSDCHYWPGKIPDAHVAFVKFCRKYKPTLVVVNGDVLDGSTISRHPPIGWETRPTLAEEIDECRARLEEIASATPNARHIWSLGNHCARYETRLAQVAPEYANVHGVHLRDHFPDWEPCWAIWLNQGRVVIKHRWKGGVHATHNNTLNSGITLITGHDHSLKVTPFSDYNGTRYGVSTGTLADAYGPQFTDYTEDNSRNHRAGFAMLTFTDGKLHQPEVVLVEDGVADFRGQFFKV